MGECELRKDAKHEKKVIFLLVDGMSYEMMQYPEMIDLSFLKNTQLAHFYPECLSYYDIWKGFHNLGSLSPNISRNKNVTSSGIAAMFSTGVTENYLDFHKEENPNDFCLFEMLKKSGILTAALTNMPITDSTVGMLLSPDKLNTYEKKGDGKKMEYTNLNMQNDIAAELESRPWNLLCGGGRMSFYPEDTGDIVTNGEYGKRKDSINVIERLMTTPDIKCIYEHTLEKENIDFNTNLRYLLLLHHNDFMYEAERRVTKTPEPRLSDLGDKIIDALDESQKDWFFFIESGKVDPAAHCNNGYFVLAEILEVYRFIYKLSKKKSFKDYTIILTSDHGTGGLSFADNYTLPYDAFTQGAYWADGPGKYRNDTTIFMKNGQLQQIKDFTPRFQEKENLAFQKSAENAKVAMHNRTVVPIMGEGSSYERFYGCHYHFDLYHKILDLFEIEDKKTIKNPKLIIITGPPASGKSTISKVLAKKLSYCHLEGDAYLNATHGEEGDYGDWRLDLAVTDMLFDAESLIRHNRGVVLDFVFIRQQEILLLEKYSKKLDLKMVILNVDEDTVEERDLKRNEEEQMGERCKVLARQFSSQLESYANLNPILPDYHLAPLDIANYIIEQIEKE